MVVVGGGVTGLTAAYRLHTARPTWRVSLLEASGRLGGNIQTLQAGGCVIDGGPDSFIKAKPAAHRLALELGLESQLISTEPSARRVLFAHAGRLTPMPEGMALGIPTRALPMLSSPLLSWRAKARLLMEPLCPARRARGEESIHDFLSRRLGEEAASRLAAPLLGGIYAGDPRALSLAATFPQLSELERQHGSLVLGTLAQRAAMMARAEGAPPGRLRRLTTLLRASRAAPPSPFVSLRGGMITLIDSLADRLPPGAVRCGQAVRRLTAEGARWRVTHEAGELVADAVVLACPARAAAEALAEPGVSALLMGIQYLSTATVFFSFNRGEVAHPLDSTGFIAPEGEGELLAATFVDSKWAGRVPSGQVLIRGFLGGARGGERLASRSDAELKQVVLSELRRLMGPLGEPRGSWVFRFAGKNPQPHLGHTERVAAVRRLSPPGVWLAGAAYDGVGIPDCVAQAERATSELLAYLG